MQSYTAVIERDIETGLLASTANAGDSRKTTDVVVRSPGHVGYRSGWSAIK